MAAKATALQAGDHVSVETRVWGDDWAKSVHKDDWKSGRTYGTVLRKDKTKWLCDFAEKDGKHASWQRSVLRFEKRAGAPAAAPAAAQKQPKATAPPDSSEDDANSDESGLSEPDDGPVQKSDGWTRNDTCRMGQRAKDGVKDTSGPQLKLPIESTIYRYALHFLPMDMIDALAARMTDEGLAKLKAGQRRYAGWSVSREKVLKWIGAWMYMLAFPIEGDRRQYWTGFEGGFGPVHCLEKYGVTQSWFAMMQDCFVLPTHGKPNDPFDPIRRWWDALFQNFAAAIDAGYILNPDESMIRWLGQNMPGFMVVERKPTPKGCEVHTMCDGQSGIMIGGEVYEGKDPMAKKEFCDAWQKSTALTLRLCKPWFGSGRVVIADSWFGSVETAKALYANGLYANLNVKTAHKGYPMSELYHEVWTNASKPSKAEKKSLGKFPKDGGKRGTHAGFVKVFNINGSDVELLAAGHNAKVPMLLVSTASDLLPGDPLRKEWYTYDERGAKVSHTNETAQPRVHALYRKYFHVVDDHNQLRQGTVTMADVWETTRWWHRHFAESLGFWEVNVFRALAYFHPDYKELKHPQFRRLLAHAMLTGGAPLVIDVEKEPSPPTPTRTLPDGHRWYSFTARSFDEGKEATKSYEGHKCGFCAKLAYGFCAVCFPPGSTPTFAICGPSTGRNCMQVHSNGIPHKTNMHKRPLKAAEAEGESSSTPQSSGGKRHSS